MDVLMLTESAAGMVAVGDASATRTVYGVIGALGLIGVVLLVLAIWLLKQTRPEPELLAPLERMNDRSWRKQEPAQMRRDLDAVRPAGARPVLRGQDVPAVDEDFEQNRPALATFEDLRAQLAADARRRPPGGLDPLLVPQQTDTVSTPGTVTVGVSGSPEIAALLGPLDAKPDSEPDAEPDADVDGTEADGLPRSSAVEQDDAQDDDR